MSKIVCGQLHSELFGRRHSTLHLHCLCVSYALVPSVDLHCSYVAWCSTVHENEALAAEVQRKTYVASNQRVSGVDAQRINSQLMELKTRVVQAEKELCDLDHDLSAEEQLYSQEKMAVSLSIERLLVVLAGT